MTKERLHQFCVARRLRRLNHIKTRVEKLQDKICTRKAGIVLLWAGAFFHGFQSPYDSWTTDFIVGGILAFSVILGLAGIYLGLSHYTNRLSSYVWNGYDVAREEGIQAHKAGMQLSNCPYLVDCPEQAEFRERWIHGFELSIKYSKKTV